MEKLTNLLWSAYRTYTKIRRKLRIKDVNENPTGAFADKFGDPEFVLDDERVQSSAPSSEMDSGSERGSDTKKGSGGRVD
ncbi:hypothetical protein DMW20_11850 [Vibrio parahaemolyticus]|nr:hypothetical protein [Vibrio parahaemolyticus]